jgi:hypothetical protein
MADRAGWQRAVEAELRDLGRELDVPPAASPIAAVRQRLEGPTAGRPHPARRGTRIVGRWRPAWRAALIVVAVLVALLAATPQGRAVVAHVLRFAGIELQEGPGPAPSPRSGAALPGERRMSLAQARRHVSFPILVPEALGRPSEVVVSDGGRVASLIYRQTPYGEVRMDEFAGHLDPVFFQKFIQVGDVTVVRVNGRKGMWVKGPHVLMYITRDGTPAAASARLTTGNTLIWGAPQVALRLEGNLTKTEALAIASSAR